MRATEIIRGLLDLIDSVDAPQQQPADDCGCSGECGCGGDDSTVMAVATTDDELRRFKQILGLADRDDEPYSNSPDERVAPVGSVTVDAGGGVNGPKHTADIRGEHGRLYGGN